MGTSGRRRQGERVGRSRSPEGRVADAEDSYLTEVCSKFVICLSTRRRGEVFVLCATYRMSVLQCLHALQ